MANSVGAATTSTASAVPLSRIYFILSDTDCVKILQMISEDRQPKISDIGSGKRYYDRMRKLKEAHLIIEKRNKRYQTRNGPGHKITSLGSIVYDTLQTLKRAENLGWILIALDTIPDDNSFKERNKLIEALIPDEDIRRILVKKRQFRNDSLRVEQQKVQGQEQKKR